MKLTKSEQTYLELGSLYESYGYDKFLMRKFEEYSLYLENKNFLTSEHILTFNDPGGKLMALRPDITLSILKNAKNKKGAQKVYYRENVCRLDKRSMQYVEIEQLGIEAVDSVGTATLLEVCELAKKSLEAVDPDYILCVSDMEYVLGFLETVKGMDEGATERVMSFIKSKNAHELYLELTACGVKEEYAAEFSSLIMFSGTNGEIFEKAKALVLNQRMEKALMNIKSMTSESAMPEKVKVDFTLMNDISYYNGPVFCGYVKKIPRAILTGGFYNRMAQKFSKPCAVGFALSLDELDAYYGENPEYDVDALLLYDSEEAVKKALRLAESMRSTGMSVRIEKSVPEGIRCREIIRVDSD